MKIYNTLSRKKEELKPQKGGEVKLYSCGPTVYDYFHIGNARPFVVFDTLRRYLEYRGEKVNFVQNFTDIDDKIIRKANEEGVSTAEVSERYIKEYFKDAEALRIRPATAHPRATENVPEIIDMVETLIEKGYAYEVNGDVYFSARKFPDYGKLSKKNVDDLETGARVEIDERKKDPLDFALWKKAKEGEPSWDSPWGKGRPGWHIECSVMSRKYLGDTIDIHGGGQDLIFPHHENEIAQSEAATGKTFSRNFMHNGYINIDNKKMSKSLGNFKTVRDILKKFDGETLRFFILSAHYRSPISFNDKILEQAKNGLARLRDFKADLETYKPIETNESIAANKISDASTEEFGDDVTRAKHAPQRGASERSERGFAVTSSPNSSSFRADFIAAMDDDLNTAKALGILFNFVSWANKKMAEKTLTSGGKEEAKNFLAEVGSVLGLLEEGEGIPAEVKEILEERKEARAKKDFAKSDELRDRLAERGYIVKDGKDGQSLVRK